MMASSVEQRGHQAMPAKKFQFTILSTITVVEAEPEGDGRYMVRMMVPDRMARVRIGYLTGARRTWVAEFFGQQRPAAATKTAKDACRQLAAWASQQSAFSQFFTGE
jgi:Lon protease-like protein